MNIVKRVMYFLMGIITLIGCAVLLAEPEYGYIAVIILLDIALMTGGLRKLIYYFTMARFMVGGLSILYEAILMTDLGLFVFSLKQSSQTVAMLYLVGTMAFSGVLCMYRAAEARRLKAGSWRTAFITGALQLIIAAACLLNLHSFRVMTELYCLGLLHTSVTYFITAFRPSAIVYVDS